MDLQPLLRPLPAARTSWWRLPVRRPFLPLVSLAALLTLPLTTGGCSKEYVRGSEDPSVDHAAMGTGLDKVDIQTLLKAEYWLIEGGTTVIDRQRQNQLIAEVEGAKNPIFNQARAPQYGKQLGVKYDLTGNVQAPAERTEDERRVQYFLFLRIVEVETGAIVWQHKAHVTKMVR